MSKEEYSLLPDEITLREIRYVIQEPGRKQQPFVIVTTMLDAKAQATRQVPGTCLDRAVPFARIACEGDLICPVHLVLNSLIRTKSVSST